MTPRLLRPPSTVRFSRKGSSGFKTGVNSKFAPVAVGWKLGGYTPFGTSKNASRLTGLGAAVSAGIMESSRGRAMIAPDPRKKVRRGNAFFVMNIVVYLLLLSGL